jgi:hypothetical protein
MTQVAAQKSCASGARHGVPMSGHLRFSAALAVVLVAGLSTSPASSNPFDFLFNAAPEPAPAPARAEEECLPHPGKSTADGQRWVYRLDGNRKCWLQVAKEVATAKKVVRPRAVKQLVAAPEEKEAALRKRMEVVDARAELLRSAPAEKAQPTPSTPEFKVVDAAAVPATGAAALVPPPPVVAETATNQLAPHPPSHVDVETLLAAAPAASDAVAVSVPPSIAAAVLIAGTGDDGRGWTTTWLGVLLMGLGLVFLLISSRTLRGALAFGANR